MYMYIDQLYLYIFICIYVYVYRPVDSINTKKRILDIFCIENMQAFRLNLYQKLLFELRPLIYPNFPRGIDAD